MMPHESRGAIVLTLGEAARFVRVSEKTLGEMARENRIPAKKVGREWRFLRTALEEWLTGSGATSTYIVYKIGSYSNNITDGTVIYNGTSNSCVHTNCLSGTSYYYTAWGLSGTTYSTNITQIMATTTMGLTSITIPLNPENVPSQWWQAPDYTKMSTLPIYPLVNNFADAFGMPYGTIWMLFHTFGAFIIGFVVFRYSEYNQVVACISLTLCYIVGSIQGIESLWLTIPIAIFTVAVWILHERP